MKYPFIIIIPILFFKSFSFSQGEIEKLETMFIDSRTFGIQLSSNGFGGDFRYQKWLNNNQKSLFSFEFVSLKDPKEFKITNPNSFYQKQFVFGKMNSVFVTRFGYGTQKKMFAKRDKGGIEINYFYQIGSNLAFLKPIYYEIYNYSTQETTIEKFDPIDIHSVYDIFGKASFLKGLNEISVRAGIFAKFGFNFEFSQNNKLVKYIEAGATIDVYNSTLPIMANEKNNFLFFSLFIQYRFGKNFNVRVSKKYQKKHPEKYDYKIKLEDIRF